MAVASPPTGVSNGALVRWGFAILNTRDVQPLRQLWTDATVQRFASVTLRGPDAVAGYFQALLAALPDSAGDRATKAAFNARTRLPGRRRR